MSQIWLDTPMSLLNEKADEKFNFPDGWDGDDVKRFAMRYMINNLEADHFDQDMEINWRGGE